jgi:hypothetical protein
VRVLSRLPRNDLLLLAVGVAIVTAAVVVGVVLARADDAASARPVPTVQVIPPPRGANANQALPSSTPSCGYYWRCRKFSYATTVDIATYWNSAIGALRATTGGQSYYGIQAHAAQVQPAAATFLLSKYCIKLAFDYPGLVLHVSPYGPRGQYGC